MVEVSDTCLELEGGKMLTIGVDHLQLHGACETFKILPLLCAVWLSDYGQGLALLQPNLHTYHVFPVFLVKSIFDVLADRANGLLLT
jgi:hypothetical protein